MTLCIYLASSPPLRARVDMPPLSRLFPFPPNTARSPLYCLSTVNDSSSQRNSKRTQPQSHSPTPLRTLLRLSPRQESPGRCHDPVHVCYRAATTTCTHLELTLCARWLFIGRQEYGDEAKADATLLDVIRGISVDPPQIWPVLGAVFCHLSGVHHHLRSREWGCLLLFLRGVPLQMCYVRGGHGFKKNEAGWSRVPLVSMVAVQTSFAEYTPWVITRIGCSD